MRSSRRRPSSSGSRTTTCAARAAATKASEPDTVAEPLQPSREVLRSASLIVLRQPIASQNPVTLPYVYV